MGLRSPFRRKHEIPISKAETNPKSQYRIFQTPVRCREHRGNPRQHRPTCLR